jgi:hypothetical protein
VILTDPHRAETASLAARTGWSIQPEGACKGEVCVPLPESTSRPDGTVEVGVLAERLGMPVVADDEHGLWALGPETAVTGRALTTAALPEIVLADVRTGEPFAISSLRGQKVMILAWASW